MGLSVALTLGVLLQWAALGTSSLQDGCWRGGGVDSTLQTLEQKEAMDFQYYLSCNVNVTANDLFLEETRLRHGLKAFQQYFGHVATYENTLEVCRASSCGAGSEVTYCIDLYHPTEDVQICMDRNGTINETDYSRLLQLQCYFNVPGPEVECPYGRDHCIDVRQPEHILDKAFLTCSVRNAETGCSANSYTILSIEVTGTESQEPRPTFENRTELVLGETNLFLCTVYFTENRVYSGFSASWTIDNVPVSKIHESPFCFLESEEDCIRDVMASSRDDRIRAYEEQEGIDICPVPLFFFHEWLWIDNATEEDTRHTYRCIGSVTFINPILREVSGVLDVTFTPVLPLLEVDVIDVPYNVSSSPLYLTFQEGEAFQWSCSVTAGEGDQLQWLFNDKVIPSANESFTVECPHNELGLLYSVSSPAEDLGGFARGYNSTLIACHITQEFSTGLYQCRLNRSRGDPVELWSADVSIPLPTIGTPLVGTASAPIGIYCGVAGGVLVLLIILMAAILCILRQRRRKREVTICALNHLSLVHTSLDTEGVGFLEKWGEQGEEGSMLYFNDPLEFPRDKLFLTNTVLGSGSFGQVLQARAEGIVRDSPGRNIVAIKTCRENAAHHEFLDLWEELQLMKRIEPHENIVNLLGQCTKPPGPVYLIVEYAMHGNLKDYLRQYKEAVERLNRRPLIAKGSRRSLAPSIISGYHAFTNREKISLSQQSSVFSYTSHSSRIDCPSPGGFNSSELGGRRFTQDSGLGMESKSSVSSEVASEGAAAVSSEGARDYISCKGLLHMEDVFNFALQIACGLQHLESLKITHCDLAARNILIAEGFVLKIGDFGMAREMSRYRTPPPDRIPVKWSAPEVIQDQVFTHQSDIWSYGVVLWEIFTYGQNPYQEQKISFSLDPFIQFLVAGNRLVCPEGCPAKVYDFMLSCWNFNPDKRPIANDLVKFLTGDDDVISVASEDSITLTMQQSPCRETPV